CLPASHAARHSGCTYGINHRRKLLLHHHLLPLEFRDNRSVHRSDHAVITKFVVAAPALLALLWPPATQLLPSRASRHRLLAAFPVPQPHLAGFVGTN